MICDDNGKYNSLIKKNIKLKITPKNSNYQGDINLFFDFRPFYNVTYINFKNEYPSSIIKSDSIDIDLSKDSPRLVNVTSKIENIDYNYKNNILTIYNIDSDIEIEAINGIYTYDYTGTVQEFITEYDGLYKVELWGAQGGTTYGGYGGYTSGEIFLTKNNKFYLHVGEHKERGDVAAAYNGGGATEEEPGTGTGDENRYGAGGGATDIRIESGAWNTTSGLKSRIMIAGAGGGGHISVPQNMYRYGGVGGGLIGGTGNKAQYGTPQYTYASAQGGTQTAGGAGGISGINGNPGSFGQGGIAEIFQCGGGAGYYGGGSSGVENAMASTGAGGSSFISGHEGCNALTSSGTHSNQSIHYSNYKFYDTIMIDGDGYNWTTEKGSQTGMPSHDGTSTMTGNTGHGYAKITLIEHGIVYKITYSGITGDYPTYIKSGKNLIIEFKDKIPLKVYVYADEQLTNNFTYESGVLTINNVENNLKIQAVQEEYNYSYIGSEQTFTAPETGIYKVELWGAQGGGYMGGLGGYTSGLIELQKSTSLYLHVGEHKGHQVVGAAYNGGGKSLTEQSSSTYNRYGSGGGATDIRTTSGAWNNATGLKSRIMVAGAGGGGYYYSSSNCISGGAGGGLTAYDGGRSYYSATDLLIVATGGNQTTGGSGGIGTNSNGSSGGFGYGGDAKNSTCLSGGGSGYYGGGSSGVNNNVAGSGAGGSSFISGHNGCNAINSSGTHTNQSIHYSNYSFTDTVMIDGEGYSWTTEKNSQTGMPTHDGTSTMTGNSDHGYAKITLLELT